MRKSENDFETAWLGVFATPCPLLAYAGPVVQARIRVQLERKQKSREITLSALFDRTLRVCASVSEDMAQLVHDFLFGMGARDGKFFNQKISRRVEHLALAEGKFFVPLQHKKIS